MMFPLYKTTVDYLHERFSKLKQGVYCEIIYATEETEYPFQKPKSRTIKGEFQGIEDSKVILLKNGRRNRAPINMIWRCSYNIEEQGEVIDG